MKRDFRRDGFVSPGGSSVRLMLLLLCFTFSPLKSRAERGWSSQDADRFLYFVVFHVWRWLKRVLMMQSNAEELTFSLVQSLSYFLIWMSLLAVLSLSLSWGAGCCFMLAQDDMKTQMRSQVGFCSLSVLQHFKRISVGALSIHNLNKSNQKKPDTQWVCWLKWM